ncbi:MAG: hypothetical protein AB7I04_02720 [Pseudomonadales bacterium]
MTPRMLALLITALASTLLLTPAPAGAASAAELLEQARGKSRDLEELKAVLNGPDPNMRIATFEVMVDSGDPTLREVAMDAALTSTDTVLQALALKMAVLAQSDVIFSLEIDTSQPEDIRAQAATYLAQNGNLYRQKITGVDAETGIFKMGGHQGQVTGTQVNFQYSYDKGTLQMVDETTLQGPVTLYKGGYAGFIATWKIR